MLAIAQRKNVGRREEGRVLSNSASALLENSEVPVPCSGQMACASWSRGTSGGVSASQPQPGLKLNNF